MRGHLVGHVEESGSAKTGPEGIGTVANMSLLQMHVSYFGYEMFHCERAQLVLKHLLQMSVFSYSRAL